MALAGERVMPVIEARWEPMARAFVVVLPGGIALPAPTEWDVTKLVRRHASGAAIRWVYPTSPGTPVHQDAAS
jgi:hypothetical protein